MKKEAPMGSLFFPHLVSSKRDKQAAIRRYRYIPGQSAFIKAAMKRPLHKRTIGDLMEEARQMDWRMS